MPVGNSFITITSNEVLEFMVRVTIRSRSVIVHAAISLERTPSMVNAKLFAAVDTIVILDASAAGAVNFLAALFQVMVMVVQVLVPKVVDEDAPKLPVRVHLLGKVDDAVLDNVAVDAPDMVSL